MLPGDRVPLWRSARHEYLRVRDDAEAVGYFYAAARDIAVMPALIVLDLGLPKLNGLEVLQRLRSDPRVKIVPIVMLTFSNEERDIAESYNMGANSYVRKPASSGEFEALIWQLATYWISINQAPAIRP